MGNISKIQLPNGSVYDIKDNVSHMTLTQEEYDALTPAQKNNGTTYFISDGETPQNTELTNVRTGYDNVVYSSAGTAVRAGDQKLQNQINQLTAVSTDAELTNIRVAANGTTYSTAGEAVRAMDSQFLTQLNAMKTGFDGVEYDSPAAMVTSCDQKLQDQIYDIDSLIVPIRGLNLFNVDDTETGYFLQYTNGLPYYISGYGESNYISVDSSTGYYADGMGAGCQVCFYDKKKEFISGSLLNSGGGSFTTPSNCIYLRISYATRGQYMRLFKSNTTQNFVPFKLYGYDFVGTNFIKNFIVVDKSGTDGCYTTLTEAVSNANDGTIIFVKKGIYNGEKVKAWGKNITIIGEDMQNTVIMNELSAYGNPPIEFSVGCIENITFYAKEGETSGSTPAYACHIEDNSLADSNLTFKHCIFKSDKNAGVGMGMRKGCNVIFDDCTFDSRDTYGLFFHDSNIDGYYGLQKVTFKNCTMYAHTGNIAVRIDSQCKVGTRVDCTFINNVLATDTGTALVATNNMPTGEATTEGTLYYLINYYKTRLCYGNNLNGLNGYERTQN